MQHKARWIIWPLLVLVPAAALFLSFRKETVVQPQMALVDLPAMQIVYVDHAGRYQQVAQWLSDFIQAAKQDRIYCHDLWVQYLDNTRLVAEDKLRSRAGCVVDAIPQPLPPGLQSKTIPAHAYVQAEITSNSQLVMMENASSLVLFAQQNGMLPSGIVMTLFDPLKQQVGQSTLLLSVVKPED